MTIVYDPTKSKGNKYSDIISEGLTDRGINTVSLKEMLLNWKHFTSVKVVHLNWFENLNGLTTFGLLKDYFRKLFVLGLLNITSKRIIWTMHNLKPHDRRLSLLKKNLYNLLVKNSKKIVIHSKVSLAILEREFGNEILYKVLYIPHPNYINHYGEIPERSNDQDTRLKLTFIGAVKPYKNLEILIDALRALESENVELSINGKPYTQEYEIDLLKRCKNSTNINLRLNFIRDEDIPSILAQNDLMICPYDISSSLNSGSVILAFSYKTSVICPRIGTIQDLNSNDSIISYDYDTDAQHLKQIIESIRIAIALKRDDRTVFTTYGERMFSLMEKEHCLAGVIDKFMSLYK